MDYLYDTVGKNMGWDFSSIKPKVTGKKWQYVSFVKKHLSQCHSLLDIGTGGGEILSLLTPFVEVPVGIDCSKGMISTASRRSEILLVTADSCALPFKNNSFDAVVSRHGPVYLSEVDRVLKPGGMFITQQVGEHDKKNIKEFFGFGQNYGLETGGLIKAYAAELRRLGFKHISIDHYDATEYYNFQDLVFLLKNTPIIPGFSEEHANALECFKEQNITDFGIKTNSERYLLSGLKA